MSYEYDVVVLGGGTGGYVAAIRAAQLGLKTAIVEEQKLGGTCLHEGCIPTKALLKSAQLYKQAQYLQHFGVDVSSVQFNYPQAQQRKDSIVQQLHEGVQALVKRAKVDVYYGTGRMLGPSIFSPLPGTISVEQAEENVMLIPKFVLLATGAQPRKLQALPNDGERVIDSTQALQLQQLPTSVVIVGGGAIGVEWASLWQDCGVQVTIVEHAKQLLPAEDEAIAKELTRQLVKKGVTVFTNSTLSLDGDEVVVTHEQQTTRIAPEKILVAVGREARIANIGLENTAIAVENHFIQVNEHYQTAESHIYAIGDVIGGLQLAHVAAREGILAVEHMAGLPVEPLRTELIARCVYSSPEVASVGFTRAQAEAQGMTVREAVCPLQAIGKAAVEGYTEGFLKLLTNAETDDVIGVHMIGANATELITTGALAQFLNSSSWELATAVYPHPTISELFGEAAMALQGKAIHF